jgi:predicted nucleotidyltransferase
MAIEPGDPVIGAIVERLVAALAPSRIYLFGSRARGDAQPDSDYDLLVVAEFADGTRRQTEWTAHAALADLRIAKDVVLMTPGQFEWLRSAAASLPATAQREGRLLYAA